MTNIPQDETYSGASKGEPGKSFEELWDRPKGIDRIGAVSHRVVGERFVITGFIFFLIAGFLALLIRVQLIVPENTFLESQTFNEVFTMHGTIMMFLFAIPILEGVAVYLIPMMIGARDLVFPRLGAYGYWCYLFGGLIVLSSFIFDAVPKEGWFMYVPLSGSEFSPGRGVDFWLIGVTLAEVSSVTAAVELIATILCSRAPGMALTKMPIFAWYILVTAFMIVIGFPPLIIGSILLEAERMLGLPFFDPSLGGDPLLWQHLFWLFGHPEVYIIFLPAAGMVATMLPTFVGKPLFGYGFTVAALVTMGFISFGLWAHHMFATGIPAISLSLFSAASMMVTIPTGIQFFCWLATLAQARPRIEVPMLFILGFLFVFVLGGLTGVMLAAVPFNFQAHDSYFVVAHLHYVLIGGMVFPLFGAAYYWIPHATGKMLSDRLGCWVFWLMFVGFNTAFLPMHVTGLRGMPRRVATYAEGLGWDRLNMLSTIGAFVLAAGIALFCFDFFRHFFKGRSPGWNPWRAPTLEWLYPPVAPGYNFRSVPGIRSREPLWDQPELTDRAPEDIEGLLHLSRDSRRETIGSHPVSGEPIQILRLPHPTWIPLIAALFTTLVFAAALAKLYWLCGVGFAGTLLTFAAWGWESSDTGVTRDAGGGLRLPVNAVSVHSHTHVAITGTVLVSGALFVSLLFGVLYLWNVQPGFAANAGAISPLASAGTMLTAVMSALAAQACWRSAGDQHPRGTVIWGIVLVALTACGMASLGWGLRAVNPWASGIGAAFWSLAVFCAVHLFIVAYWSIINTLRTIFKSVDASQALADLNLRTLALGVGIMNFCAGLVFLLAGTGFLS
jgi:cytochrome c oxidase subunit I+III